MKHSISISDNYADINYDLPAKMTVPELDSYVEAIEKNFSLYEEKNFDERMDVIDFIEFQVIDQIEELMRKNTQPERLILLKCRTEKVKAKLEKININLFQKLREKIRIKGFTGEELNNLIKEYVDVEAGYSEHQEEIGYDNLDIFFIGISPLQTMPEQTKDLEPEMVYYQKTPARIVFELVERAHFLKEDVFVDLGSGLGQVVILVNLLAGITAKGVEFEPAFCDYARGNAEQLNLSNVTFINADARQTDYSEGTVFFMFTPFKGEILQEVLEKLKKESLHRKIKIITYGPCTAQVALQSWLDFAVPKDNHPYRLGVFSSIYD